MIFSRAFALHLNLMQDKGHVMPSLTQVKLTSQPLFRDDTCIRIQSRQVNCSWKPWRETLRLQNVNKQLWFNDVRHPSYYYYHYPISFSLSFFSPPFFFAFHYSIPFRRHCPPPILLRKFYDVDIVSYSPLPLVAMVTPSMWLLGTTRCSNSA